jgi:hypothetical protein
MARPVNIIEYSFMAIVVLIFFTIGFWYLYPINPAEFDEEHIVMTTPQVHPGGELHYIIPVKK